jgi:hypothetical protein
MTRSDQSPLQTDSGISISASPGYPLAQKNIKKLLHQTLAHAFEINRMLVVQLCGRLFLPAAAFLGPQIFRVIPIVLMEFQLRFFDEIFYI